MKVFTIICVLGLAAGISPDLSRAFLCSNCSPSSTVCAQYCFNQVIVRQNPCLHCIDIACWSVCKRNLMKRQRDLQCYMCGHDVECMTACGFMGTGLVGK